ncbi:MAG TPA: hypothetical protein PLY23_09350 [Alphaproteobacteria bacterium]|nr:hypothetical protein [Alphaproteobacteria bacterium]HQS94811.1 hypothetical protein [Alphaproteobacteria bacterium]
MSKFKTILALGAIPLSSLSINSGEVEATNSEIKSVQVSGSDERKMATLPNMHGIIANHFYKEGKKSDSDFIMKKIDENHYSFKSNSGVPLSIGLNSIAKGLRVAEEMGSHLDPVTIKVQLTEKLPAESQRYLKDVAGISLSQNDENTKTTLIIDTDKVSPQSLARTSASLQNTANPPKTETADSSGTQKN